MFYQMGKNKIALLRSKIVYMDILIISTCNNHSVGPEVYGICACTFF